MMAAKLTLFLAIILQVVFLPATSGQPGITAKVAKNKSIIGEPVSVKFQVENSRTDTISWELTDSLFKKNHAFQFLKSETKSIPENIVGHEVLFTAVKGDTYLIGPFPVVISSKDDVDTLYAQAIQISFTSENLIASLHPITPVAGVSYTFHSRGVIYFLAGGLLLILMGSFVFFIFRKKKADAPSTEKIRQIALQRIADIERHMPGNGITWKELSEQVYSVLKDYLDHLTLFSHNASESATGAALLVKLNEVRFSPATQHAAGKTFLLDDVKRFLIHGQVIPELQEEKV